MANTFQGVGILWGFPGGPTGTITGMSTAMTQLQALEFTSRSQKEQIKDGNGNTSALAYTDHEDSATIDFVFSTGTGSGAATLTAAPAAGALVTLTDSNFTPLTKTLVLDEFSVSRGNTKAMMAKVTLSRYINNSLPS